MQFLLTVLTVLISLIIVLLKKEDTPNVMLTLSNGQFQLDEHRTASYLHCSFKVDSMHHFNYQEFRGGV